MDRIHLTDHLSRHEPNLKWLKISKRCQLANILKIDERFVPNPLI